MGKYTTLIFDADQTLFDFLRAEREALQRGLKDFNYPFDNNVLKIYKEVNKKLWDLLEEGAILAADINKERFVRFANIMEYQFDPIAFSNLFLMYLGKGSFLYEGSEELLRDLSKDYHIIILTNGLSDVQRNRFGSSPIMRYVDRLVISEEVGVAKPNAKIFSIALDHLPNVSYDQVLMIGDSLSSDIQGGINAGIDTCWFNPSDRQTENMLNPTYTIHHLNQLKDILK